MLWASRVVWALLPITAGAALADVLSEWDRPLRIVAAVLLWAAWSAVLVAVLAPRPQGLTAARIVAPVAVLVAVVAATGTDLGPWLLAVVTTLAAAVLLLSPSFAHTCVNAVTYGDEERFPLCTPPVFLIGPVGLAALGAVVGVAAGPLLLADGRIGPGVVALVVGLPIAALLIRSMHTLARRFAVVVPAGIVVADPLQLPDPVLFPRERIAYLLSTVEVPSVPSDVLDLRLGARRGALVLGLNVRTEAIPVRRGRVVDGVRADAVMFTVQWPLTLRQAALASQRRSRIE